jgi:hypothetical protein
MFLFDRKEKKPPQMRGLMLSQRNNPYCDLLAFGGKGKKKFSSYKKKMEKKF